MGTLGGNLCHGSPAADSAPPLIAFGARVKMIEGDKERVLPLESFFIGPGKTLLNREELMVEIQIPKPEANTGSAFLKLGRVSADLAKISIAVAVVREGDFCKDCRIVLGAVAEKPLRTIEAEKILRGKNFNKNLLNRTEQQVLEEIRPITDVRSNLWYRREVSKVLVRNAINLAWERALL
jgi:carbon-monoxide dehydrogenase medium subunit